MSGGRGLMGRLQGRTALRRLVMVPAVAFGAVLLAATAIIWVPLTLLIDLVTRRHGSPTFRMFASGLAWTWLETAGVLASTALWVTGQGDNDRLHYSLQRWWAGRLVAALRVTAGLRVEVEGLDQLAGGPVVLCSRHVSIADAIVPAWLLGRLDMVPRYVLKNDLLLDPCLDIVGSRLPNHFVDRDPDNSVEELAQVEALAHGMGAADAAVIFPEGTTVSARHRERAIARIAERDPDRHGRVEGLQHLAPVRGGGTAALLRGAPDADLVLLAHHGFEPLNRLADIPSGLPLRRPVRLVLTRIPRAEVPEGEDFFPWFDHLWADRDRLVAGWHEELTT